MKQVLARLQWQWVRWLTPPTHGEETALGEYLLNLTLLGLAGTGFLFGLVSAVLWTLDAVPAAGIGALAGFGVQPFYGLAYWLGRRGRVRLAAYVPVSVLLLVMIAANGLVGLGHATLIGFAMVVVVADILIGIGAATALALLCTAAYGATGWLQLQGRLLSPLSPSETLGADVTALALGLVIMGLLVGLTIHHLQSALQRYLTQLQYQGRELETAYEEKTRLMQTLQAQTKDHIRLMDTLERLSVSLIPVTDEILILPLAGDVDADRMEHLTIGLLDGVVARRARVVILDLTGVSRFDARAVAGLVEASRSVHLLGCELFLVGMSPPVADTLADQEPSLSEIVMLGDLQDGVARALALLGRRIVTVEQTIASKRGLMSLGAETRSVI